MMQTILPILPHSRDSLQQCPQFAPVSPIAATDKYLQLEKSTLSPPIREVRNEKELTKSAFVIDPVALLSPTNHHHPMNTTRGKTSIRIPYYSSRCNRWEMSRCREPGDAIVGHRDTRVVRSAHAAMMHGCDHDVKK